MTMTIPSTSHASSYHVFLSFRGQDTRYAFTGNLYKALTDKGIRTFIDDEDLQKGEEITPSLVKAIKESMIAIIVLSKDYASSSFCLDELVAIFDCKTKGQLVVIPVFYKVDPSDVRHHKGSYGDALAKHEKRFRHDMDRLQRWKEALRSVADLSGYHLRQGDEYEYKFIGSIVDSVSEKIIDRAPLHVADHPVGLDSRIAEVMKLLDVGSDDGIHMVGILGMGGVGKSTLARAVYNNLISQNFDGFCYLDKVREESEKHGLQHLQNILLQKILKGKITKVTSWPEGASVIADRLRGKKVLLILDDVDKLQQLQAIVGKPEWYGLGSRVIITTRDKQLLACHHVNKIYEVKELNEDDALQLLTLKAFKKEKADPSYVNFLYGVLTYASGLPLALEVIGSDLFGKSTEEWESAINQYKRNHDSGIQGILKVSFDVLQEEVKSVFLDIACCLKGYILKEVEAILHGCYGDSMKHHINVLVDKSLIKVEWGVVNMHDLIQEMGRRIDHEVSHKKPHKRKRLWLWKDIIKVLKQNKGTSEIEIIYLDVPISDREEIIEWDGNGFKKMKNLKILIIKNGKFSEGPKCLPKSLRVLEWWGYPSNCLPSDFQPHKLVMCILPNSCITSFELGRSSKVFKNLTVLKFDGCHSLTKIGDVSGLNNLEKLSFNKCENLVTVHESIGRLGKVRVINAGGCSNLVGFPPIHLTSLLYLNLSESGLESFPEVSGKMENIVTLELHVTPIKEVPISFVNLMCQNVTVLKFDYCKSLTQIPDLSNFSNLEDLSFSGCDNLVTVHESVGRLGKLEEIYARGCRKLVSFPRIHLTSLERLDLSETGFENFPEISRKMENKEELHLSCTRIKEFPISYINLMCQNVTVLKFEDCKSLTQITDLCNFSNLENLSFGGCDNLVTVHESVGRLGKLKKINAWKCKKLESFPPIHLTSLKQLNLSRTGLKNFPEILGEMENIKELQFFHTPIKELPISFVNLVRLRRLEIGRGSVFKLPISILMMPELTHFIANDCEGMKLVKEEENEETMGSVVSSKLNHLQVRSCNLDDDFFSILGFTRFVHVTYLVLSGNNFTFLPECIKEFQSLKRLDVSYCEYLQEIRGVPPKLKSLDVSNCKDLQEIRGIPQNIRYFDARNCESMTCLTTSMFRNEELYEAGMRDCYLPGEWIPEWFDEISRGPSISFWFRNKVPTNILCLLIAPVQFWPQPMVFINGKNVRRGSDFSVKTPKDNTTIFELRLKWYLSGVALRKEWNHMEVTYVGVIETSMIKATGIHVFKGETDTEDIRFSDPTICRKRKLEKIRRLSQQL